MSFLTMASFSEVMSYTGYILIAVLVLLVMITVHEFGHYIAGKIFGFGIDEFAIGFGPKIFSKKKADGEVFSVRILPIGGFCAFKGEDTESDDETAFNNKEWWKRVIVLISGALMNYILALLITITMFGVYGNTALVTYKMQDGGGVYTSENSFCEKDIILKANGKNIYLTTDLMEAIGGRDAGDSVEFLVRRNGKQQKISVTLRADTKFDSVEDFAKLLTAIGVTVSVDEQTGEVIESGLYSTGIKYGFFETVWRSFEYTFKLAGTVLTVLGQLITGALGIKSLGGTVTTITVTADAIRLGGVRNLLNIASLIGVNLAAFNLLPFPALDGSRVVFTVIEGIRKKPLNRRVEGLIHTIGFVLLMTFAVFVDLQQCF